MCAGTQLTSDDSTMKQFIFSKLQTTQGYIDQGFNGLMARLPSEVTARNTLLFCVLSLLCLGTVMVASASMPYGEAEMGNNPYYFIQRQFIYIVVALVAACIAYKIRLQFWFGKTTILLWLGSLVLLGLVLAVGNDVNGSKRWLRLGPLNLQPSEVAKFTMAVFTADYVVRRASEVRDSFKSFFRLSIPVGSTVLLILAEPDLGASAVIIMTMFIVFFLAGSPMKAFMTLGVAILGALIALVLFEPYRLERLMSFSDPWKDPQGSGYQLAQSLMAFGRGEWFGTGLGHSIQKLAYLPEAHTDFMLAVTAEELGFVGIVVIFSLSFLMVACCMRIGFRALQNHHLRSGYLAYAIASIFLLQICVNAGMNMGLIPTKGLTLPFISYGGSSLLMCAFMIGVMFKIDRDTVDKTEQKTT